MKRFTNLYKRMAKYDTTDEKTTISEISRMAVYCALCSLVIMTINYIAARYNAMILSGFGILGCGIAYYTARVQKKPETAKWMIAILYWLLLIYSITTGRNEGFSTLWLVVVPFPALYIVGAKRALPLLISLALFIAALFYTPLRSLVSVKYSDKFMNYFPMMYFIALAIAMVAVRDIVIYQRRTALAREKMREAVEYERKRSTAILVETIATICSAIDAKDEYTKAHSVRVARYSELIAHEMKLPDDKIEKIREMALLHDIGKVGIPDKILKKPGRLTGEEYSIIKEHTEIGADILKDLTVIPYASMGAKYHHERYDGKGYPSGLSGEQIPIEARIICVADSFDAMNSKRVYREKCDSSYIYSEIEKGKGTQFDPMVADAFIGILKRANMRPDYFC